MKTQLVLLRFNSNGNLITEAIANYDITYILIILLLENGGECMESCNICETPFSEIPPFKKI